MGSPAGVITLLLFRAQEPVQADDDYHGTAVVVAKRFCDIAEGGQRELRRAAGNEFRCVLLVGEPGVGKTRLGAELLTGPADCVEVANDITRDLKTLGLDSPEITVVPVERLERIASSGKLKRFVPLGAKG